MNYITFERGDPKFSSTTRQSVHLAHSCAAASVECKMATMQHKIFYVREFIKTPVQRAFRLRFSIQPPKSSLESI